MVSGGYKVITWGCQMNVEDSQQMEAYLRGLGMQEAQTAEGAEVVLLNTCSVRKKPEDKAFSMLGALVSAKEKNPSLVIGVCGCMAQLRSSEIRRRAPHVDFVVGTGQISQIPALIGEARRSRKFKVADALPERKGAVVTDVPQRILDRSPAKLKAFVPIQYGCDKFCAFCIVPSTRGRERSRPTEEILEEI
jgi:tRNA-2-methylthio-N6-dimethylallyladenosine synthase